MNEGFESSPSKVPQPAEKHLQPHKFWRFAINGTPFSTEDSAHLDRCTLCKLWLSNIQALVDADE